MPNAQMLEEIRQSRRGHTTTDAQLKALTASTPTKALPRSAAGEQGDVYRNPPDGYKTALAARKERT